MDESRRTDDQLGFQLFSVLSGVAALVLFSERYFNNEIRNGIPFVLPVALAIAMAWKPSNVRLALLFWGTYTLFLLFGFPGNNTNQTLIFFVGLGVLGASALCILEQRSLQVSGADVFRAFNPVLRICVVILYFWTFFNKLNFDFLSPPVSCATELTGDLIGNLGLSPSAETLRLLETPSVVLTLLVEGALAFGLIFRRTQRATLMLGLGFHWTLGIAGYYGFSSTMMVLLTLFAYPLAGRLFAGYDAPSFIPSVRRSMVNRVVLIGYVGALAAAKFLLGASTARVGGNLWFLLPLIVWALWLNNRPADGNPKPVRDPIPPVWSLLLRPTPLYVVALLIFLNGLSPWVGFKTEYSFAMYSNLRTEGGRTNHVLWRKPLALAPYQTDLVTVLEGSDKQFFDAYGGQPMPRYDLAQKLRGFIRSQHRSDIVLELGDDKQRWRIEAAERDSALMAPPSFLESRLLRFRQIEKAAPGECAH